LRQGRSANRGGFCVSDTSSMMKPPLRAWVTPTIWKYERMQIFALLSDILG
jgi:hypothetical protein